MIKLSLSSALWLCAYFLIAIAPLIGGVLNLGHGRGFWLNFSIAIGFVSLSIFGAQFITVSRLRVIFAPLGADAVLSLHRGIAYVAAALAILHPIILFAIDDKYIALLDIFTSPLRAKFAVLSVVLLIILVITSRYRSALTIRYKSWHNLHWVLSIGIFGTAMAHAVLVNYYLRDASEQIIWISLGGLFLAAAVWMRFINPLIRYRRRWRVTGTRAETADVTTIDLELVKPEAYGAGGFRFDAGQFAWIVARRSPFSFNSNPFSFSSSAEAHNKISFTIRSHSGFSAKVPSLQIGETVYVDGPHGGFHLDNQGTGPLLLIGAGVGVTPLVSMLKTLADRNTTRPCYLWLANRSADSIICKADIDALVPKMPLTVIHVLSDGSGGNDVPRRMDRDFVLRNLPQPASNVSAYICGAPPFMDMAAASLIEAGVPRANVHHERFGME
jgi:predicted ferric reductase